MGAREPGDGAGGLRRLARTADPLAGRGTRAIGIGTCLVVEPSSSTRMGSYNAGYYSVRMRMDPNGKIVVFPSGSGEGQGQATSISQLVADELRVPFDDISVVEGDSLACPYGSGYYSSRFSVVGTTAATLAARQLKKKFVAWPRCCCAFQWLRWSLVRARSWFATFPSKP